MEDLRNGLGPEVLPSAPITPPPDGPDLRPLGSAESFPYSFQGSLGNTGLKVATTAAMLQLVAVDPGSPAALADVPNPTRLGRVRLVAVNGLPVDGLGRLVMLAAFHPSRGSVRLTFARPTVGEPGETFVGPYELPLTVQGMAEQRADWLAAQQRFAEAVGHLMERNSDASALAGRLLLAAQDAASAEDWPRALNLAAAVPPSHPLHPRAQALKNTANDRVQRLYLAQAEALSKRGQHAEAMNLLQNVSQQAPYGNWRHEAEARYQQAWGEAQARRRARANPPMATPSPTQRPPAPTPLATAKPLAPAQAAPQRPASVATPRAPRTHHAAPPRPQLPVRPPSGARSGRNPRPHR